MCWIVSQEQMLQQDGICETELKQTTSMGHLMLNDVKKHKTQFDQRSNNKMWADLALFYYSMLWTRGAQRAGGD